MTIEETKCDCSFCTGMAWLGIYDTNLGHSRSPTKEEHEKFWKHHDEQRAQRLLDMGLIQNPS